MFVRIGSICTAALAGLLFASTVPLAADESASGTIIAVDEEDSPSAGSGRSSADPRSRRRAKL